MYSFKNNFVHCYEQILPDMYQKFAQSDGAMVFTWQACEIAATCQYAGQENKMKRNFITHS